VTIEELVKGVAVATRPGSTTPCAAIDANHNGQVTFSELMLAINNALAGCGRR